MSVINQVLVNLEKRRASLAELGVLPDHVSLAPENPPARRWGWMAAGIAVAVAAPIGLIALRALDADSMSGTDRARVASVSAGEGRKLTAEELERAYLQEIGVFRMSLELASLPPEPAAPRVAKAPKIVPKVVPKELLSSATVLSHSGKTPARDEAGDAPPRRVAVRTDPKPPTPAVKVIATPPEIRKKVRAPTPHELSDHEYRRAVALLDQDQPDQAEAGLRKALDLEPKNYSARQVLVGLLVQNKKLEEAERVLDEIVKVDHSQTGFNLTLARLQAHRGDDARAIETLEQGIQYAHGSAEYSAFLAALLQREGKHAEAIKHFRAALRKRPNFGVWWVGLGISLQATNQPAAALDAFRRAKAGGNLHPHVAALADERLKQLQ
jgi:MSHA biogenesis protein MshN